MQMRKVLVNFLVVLVLAGCAIPAGKSASPELASRSSAASTPSQEVQYEPAPAVELVEQPVVTSTPIPTPTEAPAAEETEAVPVVFATAMPDTIQETLNPLTGKPCDDPALLNLPPALVSVSNFPVTARPQAGLSYSPFVFEMYIGEGMTRFLALFYCSFPPEALSGDNTIGPIRSGRLPYQSLRKLYNGFLIMASASGEVSSQLTDSTNVFGSDPANINSALIDVGKLKGIAERQAASQPPNLGGNRFDPNPPQDGLQAHTLWIFYNYLNQVLWTYDSAQGTYLRAQDKADGSGVFIQATDRLNDEPLAFENVIVFYTEHQVLNSQGTLIDLDLMYTQGKAFLFRDGQMFPIRWSTANGEYEKSTGKLRPVRFVDEQGNPVALKPGRVWVEFVHTTTSLSETEAGMWKARFYAP